MRRRRAHREGGSGTGAAAEERPRPGRASAEVPEFIEEGSLETGEDKVVVTFGGAVCTLLQVPGLHYDSPDLVTSRGGVCSGLVLPWSSEGSLLQKGPWRPPGQPLGLLGTLPM